MSSWEIERVKEVTPEEMAWFGLPTKEITIETDTNAPIEIEEATETEVLKKRGRPAKVH